ncbi:aldehyde dehydrogenase (NADP(+)) [Lacihabitans sp. LS3-19]|uniref:aldehyde dehydrogenase (NADP(+)) n=1 Tax=Lacihabitans sp. LS3-19 TaxID=2487335 RepID=UPI0020CDCA7D|nr:aldehyde dehydrogenase (NADP(+)) [Lacihabitans sp. LS3-19]MCP9766707.1 aldehyde dehydrogenase (NADP(+)) [Lacihabitans sp. LS3-19]
MQVLGKNLIGNTESSEGTVGIQAINPASGEPIGPLFFKATLSELDLAVHKANAAFAIYRKKSGAEKAQFLEAVATEIEALGDELIERYVAESALPMGRAQGERGRTCGQLRLFASLLKEGSWVNAIVDTAQPDRQPLPKCDLRAMERPLGPVGVFGASNFPLAFSVAGGDTTSALAAGCPVVFKGHPSHLGTSELIGRAILAAAEKTNMPDGVFSLVFDDSIEIGQALVKHPLIKAIGFTGSFRGGKSLFDAAAARPEPIPVYAEMGSINPVFILPKTLQEKGDSLASAYMNSVTLGVGQFCTNPGLLVIEKNDDFVGKLESVSVDAVGGNMLNKGIQSVYHKGVEEFQKYAKVVNFGKKSEGFTAAQPVIFKADYQTFNDNDALKEEVFGPSSLVVEASSKAEMLEVARTMSGHLTASVFGSPDELAEYADLIELLEQKVGRLIFNGFPTGVEVTHAMVHGGPFPATTDSRSTSVGTMAITRFTRPVCFQDMPDTLLPAELQNENSLGIWRKVNGNLEK